MNSALLVLPKLIQNHRVWESPPAAPDCGGFFDADEIDRLAHVAWVREGSRPGHERECRREVENQLWLSGLLAPRRNDPVTLSVDRHREST